MTRVLVVEDEPQLARALEISLRAREYDVDVAPDGNAALRLAAARPPDAVLLDLGLPDMSGIEVMEGLRAWSRAPILVVSARSTSDEKVAALGAGADDYITKPFSMDELLARLGRDPADGSRLALRRQSGCHHQGIHTRSAREEGMARRERHPPHTDRMASAGSPDPQPRAARQPTPAAPGSLGPHLSDTEQLSPCLHGAVEAQARSGSGTPPVSHHRARHGIPIRGVIHLDH